MANRYWVGGTGTWNTTSTTNWSASSGGPNGASVPTAADSVFFDQATTYTVTMSGALACLDITVSAGTVTFARGTTPSLTVSGSISFIAGTTWGVVAITCNATSTGKTVTTNGTSLGLDISFNGSGGEWTLGSALTATGSLNIVAGTFTTANYNVTASNLSSSNSNTRTINLGSSTVTLSIGGAAIAFSNASNLTFNAGTSQINITSTGATSIAAAASGGSSLTFYNVSFTGASFTSASLAGASTFNNITFAGRTTAGVSAVALSSDQTINGTLTLSAGTNATMRTFVRSDTIGTTRTLTCAAVASLTDIDFRDITIAGAAAPVSGTRLGDCKGNSGITFDAPKTVWWRSSGTANWNNTASWSFTDGGTADVTAFPLAQDTATIGSTYPTSGATVSLNAAYNVGTIDMSARTSSTMTLSTSANTPTIYGNWINGTGTTLTGTGGMTFAGRVTQDITSAGKSFTQILSFNSPSGTVRLQDAFNSGSAGVHTLFAGTFDCNGYNATWFRFSTSGSLSKTYSVGSGTTTVTGGGVNAFNMGAGTNVSVTGTGTISLTSASAQTFSGGGIQTYPTLNQGGAGALTITGSNGFTDITNTYSATGATTITFTAGTTQTVSNFTATGTVGKVLTINSSSAGSAATLSKASGTVSVDYMSIRDSTATGGASWYAGANSTNVSGNTGWIFTAPPSVVSSGNFLFFMLA